MTESTFATARRIYNPLPEETTQLNLTWQSGACGVALFGIVLVAAVYTGQSRPLVSRVLTYAIGGTISLLSLTVLYLLRSIDSFINKEGERLLHDAVEKSHAKMVSWLLFFGANTNAQNSEDKTALHFACDCFNLTKPRLDMMRELIEYGADVNALSTLKETPLHCVVVSSKAMIEEPLQQSEGAINLEKNELLKDLEKHVVEKIQLLNQYGAKHDIERDPGLDHPHLPRSIFGLEQKKGATPLGLAVQIGQAVLESDERQKEFWTTITTELSTLSSSEPVLSLEIEDGQNDDESGGSDQIKESKWVRSKGEFNVHPIKTGEHGWDTKEDRQGSQEFDSFVQVVCEDDLV
jgi:hypothetical protein